MFLGSTWLQVRKFYEARRTDYVKIRKVEESCGATAPYSRTGRSPHIIDTWGFLEECSVRAGTSTTNESFTDPDAHLSSGQSSSAASGLSVTSMRRCAQLKKAKQHQMRRSTPGDISNADMLSLPDTVPPPNLCLMLVTRLPNRSRACATS